MTDLRRKTERNDQVFVAELEELETQKLRVFGEEKEAMLTLCDAVLGVAMKTFDPRARSLVSESTDRRTRDCSPIGSWGVHKPFSWVIFAEAIFALNNNEWVLCSSIGGDTVNRSHPVNIGSLRAETSSLLLTLGENPLRTIPQPDLKDSFTAVVNICR